MKAFLTILLTAMVAVNGFCQDEKLIDAYNNSITQADNSSIMYLNKVTVTEKQFNNWIKDHSVQANASNSAFSGTNSEPQIVAGQYKVETREEWQFGTTRRLVSKVEFIKAVNFQSFIAYWKKREEEAEIARQQNRVVGATLFAGGLYVLYKVGKAAFNSLSSLSTNSNSTPSNSNAINNNEKCNCTIDGAKTIFPTEVSVIFTSQKPGKIFMMNGDVYEFYRTDDRKNWEIATPVFQWNQKFKDFEDVKKYVVKKCIEDNKCR